MSKLLCAISFLLGFVLACHWDSARDLVREVSPFAPKTLSQQLKIMTGNDAKTKAKKAIEEVKEKVDAVTE